MNIFELIKKQASDEEIIEVIKNLKDTNIKDKCSWTPLHYACSFDRLKIVKFLIGCGGDVNVKDNWGRTPLFPACHYNDFEVVKFLIESGADVNTKDNGGLTPLYYACIHNNIEMIKLLIENGADVKKELEYCFEHGNIYVTRALAKAGVCFL